MKSNTYEELNKILRDLCEERTILQSRVDENNLHIQETQSLNQKMSEKEEEDYLIFSPRKNKNFYKDELEQSNIKKSDYETQNHQLLKKIEKLNSLIKVLQDVAEESKVDTEEEQKQTALSDPKLVDLQGSFYENLEHILHRVELSSKFINQDPNRAQMELAVISENLQRILQQNIEE